MNFHADPIEEMKYFIDPQNNISVNGLMTDCPHTAMHLRDFNKVNEIIKNKYIQADDSSK